jgi:hypothetical protein
MMKTAFWRISPYTGRVQADALRPFDDGVTEGHGEALVKVHFCLGAFTGVDAAGPRFSHRRTAKAAANN